jgi:hypothetical protein
VNPAVAYACLGTLVGVMAGLSSSPIAAALLAALFTFAGGSAAHLIDRKPAERRHMSAVLGSFSIFCLLGILGGIAIKENRLLTFRRAMTLGTSGTAASEYFKSDMISFTTAIDLKFRNGDIDASVAYRELRSCLERVQRGERCE